MTRGPRVSQVPSREIAGDIRPHHRFSNLESGDARYALSKRRVRSIPRIDQPSTAGLHGILVSSILARMPRLGSCDRRALSGSRTRGHSSCSCCVRPRHQPRDTGRRPRHTHPGLQARLDGRSFCRSCSVSWSPGQEDARMPPAVQKDAGMLEGFPRRSGMSLVVVRKLERSRIHSSSRGD